MIDASVGVNASAQLIPMVLTRVSEQTLRLRAKRCLRGLCCFILNVLSHRTQPMAAGAYLFASDRLSALVYVQALLDWARETAVFRAEQRQLPWDQRKREADFDGQLRARLGANREPDAPFNETTLSPPISYATPVYS